MRTVLAVLLLVAVVSVSGNNLSRPFCGCIECFVKGFKPVCAINSSSGIEKTFPNECFILCYRTCLGMDYKFNRNGLCWWPTVSSTTPNSTHNSTL